MPTGPTPPIVEVVTVPRLHAVAPLLVGLLLACEGPACVEGSSQACACTDGRSGAQTCTAEGVFGPCECADSEDAGVEVDAGSRDSGAAPVDSGADDSGTIDSGADSSTDSGSMLDSGDVDAGFDAGSPSRHVVSFPVDPARILVSNAAGDLYPTTFTYEMWIRFDRIIPGLTQNILLAEGGSPVGTLRIWIDSSDTLECIVRAAVGSFGGFARAQVTASSTVTAGVWHHLACTGDGAGSVELWLDGTAVASDTISAYQMPSTVDLGLGSGPIFPLPEWRFQGAMDEFRVSDRVVYTAPFTPERRLTADTSTIALFHFDEGMGTSAMDEVGPGRHAATLDMGATWAPE